MKRLWLVEFGGEDVPTPDTSPKLDELEVVVADTHFAIVRSNYEEAEAAVEGLPYWRVAGHPSAGRWLSASGDEVYIDDNCEIADDGYAVLVSLGIEIDPETEDADDVLDLINRTY